MRTTIFFIGLLSCLLCSSHALAKFPVHLGGFKLGDDISNYQHLINMETCQQVLLNRYISEGEIYPSSGIKSGLIAYGMCDQPKKILRIKLKYSDGSKKFFNQLMKMYTQNLGEPSEYKGDAFNTVIAWKWSFTNEKKERISLILQHNQMSEEDKIGNAVKMTLTTQLEKERACFANQHPSSYKKMTGSKESADKDWKLFVPY